MTVEERNKKINYYLTKLDDKLDIKIESVNTVERLNQYVERVDEVVNISSFTKERLKNFIQECNNREDLIEIVINTEQYDFDYRILAIRNDACPYKLLRDVRENFKNKYTKFEMFLANRIIQKRVFKDITGREQ